MSLNSLELVGATTLLWLAYRIARAAIRATRSTTVLGRQHVAHKHDRWEAGRLGYLERIIVALGRLEGDNQMSNRLTCRRCGANGAEVLFNFGPYCITCENEIDALNAGPIHIPAEHPEDIPIPADPVAEMAARAVRAVERNRGEEEV